MSKRNPTSAIRGGFDYQDWWGLKLCGDWLGNPAAYQWIWFETAPEGAGAGRFYLDDIVLLDAAESYHLYQIKHRQRSDNAWTWEQLLSSSERGTSALQKWVQSLVRLKPETIGSASFITNGIAGEDIALALEGKKVDIARIKDRNPDLYSRILNQIGDETNVDNFFSVFEFRFGEPDLSILEHQVRDTLHQDLRATESGINNLLLQIHKECRREQTQSLFLGQLRQWCEFDDPRPLKEEFFIPEDFQFFDEQIHKRILRDLKKADGGIKVIIGKPGTGKSVYLSKLHETLTEQKVITIRHHYHLSPEDKSPQERLNADRVIEALKAQFKQYPKELGDLANKNSENISLREFITALASDLHQQSRAFVLIIDGLDHVIRNADIEELNKFLLSVCFPQPGLWIVLGMQSVVSEHLPGIVHERCPSDTWTEMSGLSLNAVGRIVTKNCINLNLPDNKQGISNVVDRIFDATEGNPLHLRYLLNELKINNGASLVTEYSIEDIVPYGGDIVNYYRALWGQLNDKAKTILFTLASVNFVFKRRQLLECVSSFERNPSDLSQAFRSIQHLIREDRRDRISVYHNSFQVFLLDQSQFDEQKLVLKNNIKDWLVGSSYKSLKWAELRKIEYELGNPKPLLQLDRQWLLTAISHPRNSYQIDAQLLLACKAAFEVDDFPKTLQLSYLRTYYLNSPDLVEGGYEKLFSEAIRMNEGALSDIDVARVHTAGLVHLASLANDRGDFAVIDEIIDDLLERQESQDYHQRGLGGVSPIPYGLVQTIPYDRTHDPARVHRYIKQFGDLGWTSEFFGVYTGRLLALDQLEKVKTILALDLTQEEKEAVLVPCIRYDLEHHSNYFEQYYDQLSSCLIQISKAIDNGLSDNLPSLPSYDSLPTSVPEYDSKTGGKWTDLFYDYFFVSILYGLAGNQKDIVDWIDAKPDIWCANALSSILKSGLQVSQAIQTDACIGYEDVFSSFSELQQLRWPDDRDQLALQASLSNALFRIMREVLTIKRYLNDMDKIEEGDLINIICPPFFTEDDFLRLLRNESKPLLSPEAYEHLIDEKEKKIEGAITYFPERTVAYADLASLARLHGDTSRTKVLLLKASDNLLGYGYHKDIYQFEVLEAMDFCGLAGTPREKIDDWLKRMIPIVENVTSYTDGDETNYLPLELAEMLGRYDRASLYKDYFAHADEEDLFHAEDLFKRVIRSMSYEKDEEVALGVTAIDKDSLEELKSIAQESAGAQRSLEMITDDFGTANYLEDPTSASSFRDEEDEHDYQSVPPAQLGKRIRENSFENRWSQQKYLEGWLSYWMSEGNKEEVYRTITDVASDIGLRRLFGDLLDKIYPLAYEFENDRAFDLLCRAHANDYGWQRFMTDKVKAEMRWEYLRDKYPSRYLEFFKKSIAYCNRTPEDSARFMPLSRGVEFLIMFKDLEKAESITEASVALAEQLMADIHLPPAMWEKKPYDDMTINEVDLLIQRLLWPSPLVRERAATALAWLLAYSPSQEEVYGRYLDWIKEQKLESVVAVALLPLFRTLHFRDTEELSYIKFEEIVESLPVGSVVIQKLVEELANEMGIDMGDIEFPEYAATNPCPDTYQINGFFQKHIRGFLAPIYHDRAEEIEMRYGSDFIKQWAFIADELISAIGIRQDADVAYFQGRAGDVTLLGMSTKLSEVYRSAFVRVLQHFFAAGAIPEDYYLQYAYATVPIDLTLWRINMCRAPDWWPKLRDGNSSTLAQVGLEEPIESLIEPSKQNLLLYAQGAVAPSGGWDGSDILCSFSLIGFGYQVKGSDIPTAEEVAEELIDAPASVVLIPSRANRPFHFLDNHPNYYPIRTEPREIRDIVVYPLIVGTRDLTISLWQFFRDYPTYTLLAPEIQRGLSTELRENSYVYKNDDQEVAFIRDWLEGLKERNDSDLPRPYGQWFEIDRAFLQSIFDAEGIRLGHLLKTTYRHKQYRHSDVKSLDQYQLINVSSIILPPPPATQ